MRKKSVRKTVEDYNKNLPIEKTQYFKDFIRTRLGHLSEYDEKYIEAKKEYAKLLRRPPNKIMNAKEANKISKEAIETSKKRFQNLEPQHRNKRTVKDISIYYEQIEEGCTLGHREIMAHCLIESEIEELREQGFTVKNAGGQRYNLCHRISW